MNKYSVQTDTTFSEIIQRVGMKVTVVEHTPDSDIEHELYCVVRGIRAEDDPYDWGLESLSRNLPDDQEPPYFFEWETVPPEDEEKAEEIEEIATQTAIRSV